MHILQMSDFLPDRRVEKTIHSDLRLKNKVSYIGLRVDNQKDVPNVHVINLTSKTALYRMNKFQKELKSLVTEIDPDVIHAHDILMGRAVIDFGYPVVYNDHEYHSKKEWINNPLATPWTKTFIKRKVAWPYRYITFRRWEKKILTEAIVIVTNENVAKEHMKKGATTFIIPNYPEKNEVKTVWEHASHSTREYDAAYVGNDMSSKSPPYRQAHQAYSIISTNYKLIIIGDRMLKSDENILSTGYVPHDEIYKHVMRAWTGLLAWKPHYFHSYCSPNKFLFYIHSGAVPIVPYTLDLPQFDLSLKFTKINQIPRLIEDAKKQFDPTDVIEQAKEFLWEKHDHQLKQAYELAVLN